MLEILEERASKEVIKRDEAIEVLQKELDWVEEKKQLAIEVANLRTALLTIEDLKIQVGGPGEGCCWLKGHRGNSPCSIAEGGRCE